MTQKPKSQTASQVTSVVNLPGYQIKDVLGKGGMAVVYLAVQESIGREVALKILAPDHTDETFTDRFLAEARIISSLNHPNIITVYDAGVYQGCHYMAMEYVPGKSLRDARDLLSRKQKIHIVKQMAQALDYAGKKGYVHRDIKPENILLHEDGRAILTDFGIARSLDATRGLTVTGKTIGTPYYMSPEQTKGVEIDHRSDIYSLGVVLFQCLAGYIPYDGPSMVAIGIKHISEPIPELPVGLDVFQPIINICLSKDPDHRYRTAEEFYNALQNIPDAELDYIDAKVAALKKKGKDYNAKTMASSSITPPSASYSVQSNQISSGRQQSSVPQSTRQKPTDTSPSVAMNITESDDYKRLKKRRRWIIILTTLFILIGIGVYKRDYFSGLWLTYVQPEIDKLINAKPIKPVAEQSPVNELPVATTTNDNAPREKRDSQQASSLAPTITLANQADILQQVETQPELLEPLAQEYKALLAYNPNDQLALDGIDRLAKWYILHIRAAVDQQNTTEARNLIVKAKQHLGPQFIPEQILLIEEKLLRQEAIKSHIDKARDYFSKGNLIVPAGENALDEWQAVLAIDPDNSQAKQGIKDIADYQHQLAVKQYQNGKYHEALARTELGLTADKNHTELLQLKQSLDKEIEKQNRILSLIIRAEAQFQANKVIEPAHENAYDLYKAALKEQSDNQKAREGLRKIENYLTRQVNTAVWENKLTLANKILNQGLARFPNSAMLDQAKAKLHHAINTRSPRITHILFSDAPIGSLLKEQARVNTTKRLHVGFSYTNLTANTTLLTAYLSGTDQQQLVKKLIVSDKSGEHMFYFDHPTGSFPAGNYRFTVELDKKKIFSTELDIGSPPSGQ